MTVVNIPNDGLIYRLGKIDTLLHIYDMGPPHQLTNYDLTIVNVGFSQHTISGGETQTFNPAGNMVFILNHGPATLQALFGNVAQTPEEAGLEVVDKAPKP